MKSHAKHGQTKLFLKKGYTVCENEFHPMTKYTNEIVDAGTDKPIAKKMDRQTCRSK